MFQVKDILNEILISLELGMVIHLLGPGFIGMHGSKVVNERKVCELTVWSSVVVVTCFIAVQTSVKLGMGTGICNARIDTAVKPFDFDTSEECHPHSDLLERGKVFDAEACWDFCKSLFGELVFHLVGENTEELMVSGGQPLLYSKHFVSQGYTIKDLNLPRAATSLINAACNQMCMDKSGL